jgi:hypothetical protein
MKRKKKSSSPELVAVPLERFAHVLAILASASRYCPADLQAEIRDVLRRGFGS